MSQIQGISKGDSLHVQGFYDKAIEVYTCCIDKFSQSDQTASLAKLHRGISYFQIGLYKNAIQDFDASLNKINEFQSYFFKGKAHFFLEEFQNALIALNRAKDISSENNLKNDSMIEPWIRKCQCQISGAAGGEKINSAAFLPSSKHQKLDPSTAANEVNIQDAKCESKPIELKKITKIDYYQNTDKVAITVIIKPKLSNQEKKSFIVEINKNSIHLSSSMVGIDKQINLFGQIDQTESSYNFGVNLQLTLKKKNQGFNWISLQKKQGSIMDQQSMPSYPSSSKTKKNWSEVDKNMQRQIESEKPEGEAAMMGMFKEIFAQGYYLLHMYKVDQINFRNGDPETQRAMMKSYQTSGGTVLSTNWKEVKDKDYEGKDRPQAPKGQQWADKKP